MEVVINQTVKKFDVQLTSNPKKFEVVVSSNPVSIVVEMGMVDKQGFPGLSAYQLAVKNGLFQGTENEYLESLKPSNYYKQENIGSANGITVNFNLLHAPKINNENVYLNGLKLSRYDDYSLSSNIITFITAPIPGDIIEVEYYY